MHIQLPQRDAELAAGIVSSMVDRSAGPLPVLSNLLIEATGSGIVFRGTDMEALVTVNTAGTILQPGRTTVPAETFRDIVKLMPASSEIALIESGRKLSVVCESSDYKLMTLSADDFPEFQTEPVVTRFQVTQKAFKSMIEATSYALPVRDHRRVLLGVNLEVFENTLRMTATDGKKLARASVAVPEIEGNQKATIVVPRKLLENLKSSLHQEGPVDIEMSQRQISFRFANVHYRGNGIEGKYPDCDLVIPREFPQTIVINRDAFSRATRRAGIITDRKTNPIILKFEQNQCSFSAMAHDVGNFMGKMTLDYSGPPMEMAFNYVFLLETLERFDQAELLMLVKSPTAPVVFRNREDANRLSLLMPVKLSDIRPAVANDEESAGDEA